MQTQQGRISMKPNDGNIRSISTSRKSPAKKNVLKPTKILRKLYEARAKTISSNQMLVGVDLQPTSDVDNGQRPGLQLKVVQSEHVGIQFHTPFKIDRALLKLIQYHQTALQSDGETAGPTPTLSHFLQIKSVNRANPNTFTLNKPSNVQQLPKFVSSLPASLANSHVQQKSGPIYNESLIHPAYNRKKEGLNDSFENNGSPPKNEIFNFKAASYIMHKNAGISQGMEDDSRSQSHLDMEMRTARPIDLAENGIRQQHFRAISESPTRLFQADVNRNNNEEISYRHQGAHATTPRNNQSESETEGEKIQGRNEERLARNAQTKDDKNLKVNYYNNRYYSSGLPFKTAVGIYQSQLKELGGQPRPYPPRANLTPIASTQQINEQNKNENNIVLLPLQKSALVSSNSNPKSTNRAGGNLLTSNIENTPSISTTTGSLASRPTPNNSMNPLSASLITGKKTRSESLKPEERGKRRNNYQAQANTSSTYKYFLGYGNNTELVKRVLSKRENWEQVDNSSAFFHLKWQQNSKGYRFERLIGGSGSKQLLNHFEYHREITTKNGLIKSMSAYCDTNKINLFDLTPITFSFDMEDETNFDADLHRFTRFFIKHCGDPKKYASNEQCTVKRSNPNILFTYEFKRKGKVVHIMQNFNDDRKFSPYLKPKIYKTYYGGGNMWLLKPTGLNRGRGIELFNTLEDLNRYINQYLDGEKSPKKKPQKGEEEGGSESGSDEESKQPNKGPPGANFRSRTFVIQKYIEHPLLVYNRKFDIRVYVMITHEMQLYFYKEGYLRTSSEIYSIGENDIDNKFMHLTNDAVQKYSDKYGAAEKGNKLSYEEFQKYANEKGIPLDVKGKVIPRMKELVQISMNSVKKVINLHDRKYCFEVFGYDFFIDAELNVWLIEINTNPCLEESCPLLGALIPRMIHDAFKLTVDVLFPPPSKAESVSSHQNAVQKREKQANQESPEASEKEDLEDEEEEEVEKKPELKPEQRRVFPLFNYHDNENLWEHLCSLEHARASIKKPSVVSNSQKPNIKV